MSLMTSLMPDPYYLDPTEKKYMTEDEVRALLSTYLTNFDQTTRVQRGFLQSGNFQTGVSGWNIDAEGNVEFNSGTFRGTVTATAINIPNATSANSFHVDSNGNTWWGANVATGYAGAPAYVLNTGAANFSNVTINSSTISNSNIFGNGEDGSATINADTSLSKDTYYDTLTITGSKTLTTNGYRLFVKNTLTIDSGSKIAWNGNAGTNGQNASGSYFADAAGGTGGTGLTSQSLFGSVGGQDGGYGARRSGAGGIGGPGLVGGNGTAGSSVSASFQTAFSYTSGAGGKGGDAWIGAAFTVGQAGGSAGASGSLSSASKIRPFNAQFAIEMMDKFPAAALAYLTYNAGTGGAGGGASGVAAYKTGVGQTGDGSGGAGGGSGSGGGTVVVCARIIINNGAIQAVGGNGGVGGAGGNADASSNVNPYGAGGGGGGGGGAGGPGGVVVLVYSSLTGSGTISVSGGASGVGGTKGLGSTAWGADSPAKDGGDGVVGITPAAATVGKIIQLIV